MRSIEAFDRAFALALRQVVEGRMVIELGMPVSGWTDARADLIQDAVARLGIWNRSQTDQVSRERLSADRACRGRPIARRLLQHALGR